MLPVELHDEAAAEAELAVAWYRENAGEDVALRLTGEISAALDTIGAWPRRSPVDPNGVFRLALGEFPYVILYEIDGARVLVLAVAHAKRRPGYWSHRR